VRAGRLTESIQIYSYTSTQDSYGQETKTYTLTSTVRAEVKTLSESENENGGKIDGKSVYQFYLRYTDINKKDRITWNGRDFEIIEIITFGNRRGDMKIKAATNE